MARFDKWRHTKLPGQGAFTFACALVLDLYELPFPGLLVITRYPRAGGYVAGPLVYWLVAYGPLSSHFSATPYLAPLAPNRFVTESSHVNNVRMVLCGMFMFHFLRPLVRVCLLRVL
jgi:hypothetical protein